MIDLNGAMEIKLINVIFSREMSAVSFRNPNWSRAPVINEISVDVCVCSRRLIREPRCGGEGAGRAPSPAPEDQSAQVRAVS